MSWIQPPSIWPPWFLFFSICSLDFTSSFLHRAGAARAPATVSCYQPPRRLSSLSPARCPSSLFLPRLPPCSSRRPASTPPLSSAAPAESGGWDGAGARGPHATFALYRLTAPALYLALGSRCGTVPYRVAPLAAGGKNAIPVLQFGGSAPTATSLKLLTNKSQCRLSSSLSYSYVLLSKWQREKSMKYYSLVCRTHMMMWHIKDTSVGSYLQTRPKVFSHAANLEDVLDQETGCYLNCSYDTTIQVASCCNADSPFYNSIVLYFGHSSLSKSGEKSVKLAVRNRQARH